jgi:hypothetical protein
MGGLPAPRRRVKAGFALLELFKIDLLRRQANLRVLQCGDRGGIA